MCQDFDSPSTEVGKLEKAIRDDDLHEVKITLDSIIKSKNDLTITDFEWKLLLETVDYLKMTETIQLMYQYEKNGFRPFSGCILRESYLEYKRLFEDVFGQD